MSAARMTAQEYAQRQAANVAARRKLSADQTERLRIVLPWPPSVNHSTAPNGRGGKILTDEHRRFREAVALRVVAAGTPRFRAEARLAVEIHLTPPDRRRCDIDNRIKAVLDALQRATVFHDDEQVDDIHVIRGAVMIPGEGSAVITIKEIG